MCSYVVCRVPNYIIHTETIPPKQIIAGKHGIGTEKALTGMKACVFEAGRFGDPYTSIPCCRIRSIDNLHELVEEFPGGIKK